MISRGCVVKVLQKKLFKQIPSVSKFCSSHNGDKSTTQQFVQDVEDRDTMVFQSSDDRTYLMELNESCGTDFNDKLESSTDSISCTVILAGVDGNVSQPLGLNAHQNSYIEHINFPDLMSSHSQPMVPAPEVTLADVPLQGILPGGDLVKHSKFVSSSHHNSLEKQIGNNFKVCTDASLVCYNMVGIKPFPGRQNAGTFMLMPYLFNHSLPASQMISQSSFHSNNGNLCKSSSDHGEDADTLSLSQREKLKRAVKEYGSTVIIFHVGISLVSLGGFYVAVSSGLDVEASLRWMGVSETYLQSKLTAGASTFVLAYAIHKVFAPVRIGITLTCTPLIVRYLRRVGFLKPPKPKCS